MAAQENSAKADNATTGGPDSHQAMHEAQFFGFMRLDRARRRWRLLAVVAVFFFLITAFTMTPPTSMAYKTPHIAHIQVEGLITDTLHQQKILQDIAENDAIKAAIVYVDSPGGTMVGGLNLHKGLRRLAKAKPVVTVMGTMAASAGYMVSAAGSHVIASPGTITGSIGVMMPLVDATELAAKIGVKNDEVVSGELKTATSPLHQRSTQDKAYLQQTVEEMKEVFIQLVTSRRQLSADVLNKISDGRIVTGKSAHDMNLVDALGGRETARDWLENTQGIEKNLPLVDKPIEKPKGFMERMMYSMATLLFSKQNFAGIMAHINA